MFGSLGTGPTEPSPLNRVRLAVHVEGGRNITIQNQLADVEARVDLDIRGTVGKPALTGHIEASGGTIAFQGKKYSVTRGNINFVDPVKIEPVVDIQAETQILTIALFWWSVDHRSASLRHPLRSTAAANRSRELDRRRQKQGRTRTTRYRRHPKNNYLKVARPQSYRISYNSGSAVAPFNDSASVASASSRSVNCQRAKPDDTAGHHRTTGIQRSRCDVFPRPFIEQTRNYSDRIFRSTRHVDHRLQRRTRLQRPRHQFPQTLQVVKSTR